MQSLIRMLLVLMAGVFLLSQPFIGSVIFQPGKKAKYVPPGEEEINGQAAEQYQIGQAAEKEGDFKKAIRAYRSLVKHHPKDKLAAEALYRAGQLQEQLHEFTPAAQTFQELVERYPSSEHFEEAIEAQFRVGE